MKAIRILIIGLTIALSSCSADRIEETCECQKNTYDLQSSIIIGTAGLPQTVYQTVLISSERVICQEEGTFQLPNNEYYVINCQAY